MGVAIRVGTVTPLDCVLNGSSAAGDIWGGSGKFRRWDLLGASKHGVQCPRFSLLPVCWQASLSPALSSGHRGAPRTNGAGVYRCRL